MSIGFGLFLVYGIGSIAFPRVTLAIICSQLDGWWAIPLAVWALMSASEHRPRTIAWVNAVGKALTGKQIVVVQEKIVEKEVVKVQTIEKVVTKVVRIKEKEMSPDEALSCLGCAAGATDVELAAGYKAMIQRVHPDKGGSTYLAAMVNQARTMLLK